MKTRPSSMLLALVATLCLTLPTGCAAAPEPGDQPPPAQAQPPRRAQAQQQRERLQAELARLEAAGEADQAAQVRERLEQLDRRLANARGPRPQPIERPNFPQPGSGPDSRRHHLEIAIEHLHAAGLHEPAEQLTRQLEHLRRTPPPHAQGVPAEEIERLHARIGELEHHLQALREEVAELRRARR